jgi:hypothetical protein
MPITLKQLIEREELVGLPYEEIARTLNEKPLIDNPEPQENIIKETSIPELLGLIRRPDSETIENDLAVLANVSSLIEVGEKIGGHLSLSTQGNIPGFIDLLEVSGLNPDTAQILRDRLAETMPDPNYQSTIFGPSLAEEESLGFITGEQVQGAFHGGN